MQFGPYRVSEKLVSGSRGHVYRANHVVDGGFVRDVVLVALNRESTRDRMLASDFAEATKLAARLDHNNVARIHDLGCENGRSFMCRESIDGASLAELLVTSRALRVSIPAEHALYIALRLVEAVAHAHGQAVLHKYLDATSVIISTGGEVKVIGFGGEGLVRRRPQLSAPEITAGSEPDKRADVFSCGSLLDQLMRTTDACAGDLITRVSEVVRGSTHESRLDRYADAGEMFNQLRQVVNDLGYVSTARAVAAWLSDADNPARTVELARTDPVLAPVAAVVVPSPPPPPPTHATVTPLAFGLADTPVLGSPLFSREALEREQAEAAARFASMPTPPQSWPPEPRARLARGSATPSDSFESLAAEPFAEPDSVIALPPVPTVPSRAIPREAPLSGGKLVVLTLAIALLLFACAVTITIALSS